MDDSYQTRIAAWEKAKFSPPPEPPLKPTEPTQIEMVQMRDGVKLYTEIFLPPQAVHKDGISLKAFPVILSRSPYPFSRPSRHDRRSITRFLEAGYTAVFQLTRGQGHSEGRFQFLRDDINDGYDTIQWIAEQLWCNGKVGMEGSSYQASTQLLAARAKPPALKCIMPTAFVGNFTHCSPFSYGVPNKGNFLQWLQVADAETWDSVDVAYGDMNAINHPKWGPAFRKRPLIDAADDVLSGDKLACWRETMAHPKDDEYWAPVHFTDDELTQLDLPIFFTDGWYDMTIGPIDFFTRLEQTQPGRSDRYLLVGPWDHYQTFSVSQPGENSSDRVLPNNGAIDLVAQRLAFFNRYLKDDHAAPVQKDRVRVYITGASDSNVNDWFNFSTFPVPSTDYKSLYLHSQGDARSFPGDGILSWDAPTDDLTYQATYKPSDQYIYDPALPTASLVETYQDRRHTEIRSDVLTYTSAPLTKPLTILGDITLIMYAASDVPDTDWFAVITEVLPDGQSKSFHYSSSCLRARYRDGMSRDLLLTPNKPEVFRISMGPAGHQISRGYCLRLSIFSAAYPEYDPNTNRGGEVEMETQERIAKQTIFHDSVRPSHIVMPVVDLS